MKKIIIHLFYFPAQTMKSLKFQLFILIGLLLAACDQRPFAHIEVHGRTFSKYTNQPTSAEVQLWTGPYPTDSKGAKCFAVQKTDAAGYFDIKTNAGWNSGEYYLEIVGDSFPRPEGYVPLHINKGKNVDAGIIVLQ